MAEENEAKLTDGEAELVGIAFKKWCHEFLAGKQTWESMAPDARPIFCQYYLGAIALVEETTRPDKDLPLAVRATELLLATPGAIVGATENERVAKARREVVKDFKAKGKSIKPSSLASFHRVTRNKKPSK